MDRTLCTSCLRLFDDDRPPPDESLPGIPDPLCPECWANKLAWEYNEKRTYIPEEQLLVSVWNEQWDRLSELLIKVFSSSDPPDIYDEIMYVSLRSWFLEHQNGFLKVFADLYEAPVVYAVYDDSDELPDPEEAIDAEERHWNPFQWYYRESDIYQMAGDNKLLISADPWMPDESELAHMRFDFEVTKAMMIKIKRWVLGNNSV